MWIELLEEDCGIDAKLLKELRQETEELISIFVTMSKNVKARIG